jgi:hypothetical protein
MPRLQLPFERRTVILGAVRQGLRPAAVLVLALGCGINPAFDVLDAGGSESGGGAAISVFDLRAAWSTPNQVRWVWNVQGEESDFVAYELVIGPSEDEVRERAPTTTVFDGTRNPELGVFILPRTFQALVVEATTTDLMEPDTVYYAQLLARDTAGAESRTNVAVVRTDPSPSYEIVLLAEGDSPGTSIPSTYVVDTAAPYAGTEHFSYVHTCEMATCAENLQRQGLMIDLAEIRQGDYATTAYLEFAVSLQDSIPWWYGGAYLWYGGEDALTTYSGWQIAADGEYRVIQAPLDEFVYPNEPGEEDDELVPYEALEPGVTAFVVGGHWSDGATVRVDEARLKW